MAPGAECAGEDQGLGKSEGHGGNGTQMRVRDGSEEWMRDRGKDGTQMRDRGRSRGRGSGRGRERTRTHKRLN